ncbi:MAG: transposase, partial [Stellaceae bacterium]
LLAVDGTRIKAVNNKDRNFTRASLIQFIQAADAKLNDYLQRLDKSDTTESGQGGSRIANLAEKIAAIQERCERHKNMLAELDQTGESQISLTDPDSRAMAAHTHVAVGYNVQVAVDAKHKLIVEQQVTNQVVDMGLLAETAEPAKEVLGVERIAVVADRGYFKIEDIEACEKAGLDPYVPRPQRGPSVRAGLFRKDEFSYDPASDSFLCPAGQHLFPYSSSLMRGLKKINYCNRQACRDCTIRSQCTGNQFRYVSRLENEAVLDRMQARIAQRPDILDRTAVCPPRRLIRVPWSARYRRGIPAGSRNARCRQHRAGTGRRGPSSARCPRPPNGCDPRCNRGLPACLALACLAWRSAG